MQSIKILRNSLEHLGSFEHYLFAFSDFRALFPEMSQIALKSLLGRAGKDGILKRVCRGIYLYERAGYPRGTILFHAASRLRAGHFNYISLETALSEEGLMSQMPINRITLMSSGRSNIVDCGTWGSIEFIHTKKKPEDLESLLVYDTAAGLWRAKRLLALRDLKAVGRNLDLIDWDNIYDVV